MATDVPAFKAKLLEEQAVVAQEVALIDLPAEKALYDQAQAVINNAQVVFDKKRGRWDLVQEKLSRLQFLDAQIAIFNP